MDSYLPSSRESVSEIDRNRLISVYFKLGFTYNEITAFLKEYHGFKLSVRQLKRVLQSKGLRRRRQKSPLQDVLNAVRDELNGSGNSIGYRQMHRRIMIHHGFVIDRETVRIILQHLDPAGVERCSRRTFRRRLYSVKGPNYLWHLDGYDKLKPFGFPIHGCIDGFSRRILWLRVGHSNNNPRVISSFFLSCIKEVKGIPRIVRGDRGSENVNVAGLQRFFRRNSLDSMAGNKSFIYGRSVSNRRIEAWWSFLRKSETDWWIKFFRHLADMGYFDNSDPIHLDCIKFCFTAIIQNELTRIAKHWNLHKIRPCANAESHPGRPDVLYFLPQLHDTVDYKITVPNDELSIAEESCCESIPETGCSNEFQELASLIMEDEDLQHPTTPQEATLLYLKLLGSISNIDNGD